MGKIRSRLSVKVFLLTAFLLAGCCGITSACIIRFAPYVYRHDVSEIEYLAEELAMTLADIPEEELVYFLGDFERIVEEQTEGEYVIRLFDGEGGERRVNDPGTATGRRLADFVDADKTKQYEISFSDGTETYTFFISKNTEKESQVVEALKKSLPILYGVIFAVSVTAAFFYTWYVTRPIKRISAVSRRMADLDFLDNEALPASGPGGCGVPEGQRVAAGEHAMVAGERVVTAGAHALAGDFGFVKRGFRIGRHAADRGSEHGMLCPTGRTDEIGVLADSLNELWAKLSEALWQLREANRRLLADIDMERELERQRLAFFSAASHELKTPITIIRGQLEGMLYQVGRFRDRERYLRESLEVTDTLEKMVQELLVVSRLDAPGYTCEKERFSLDALINERLDAFEELFAQKELALERDITPAIELCGDKRLIEKVMDNLLSNAAAYSPPGNKICARLWHGVDGVCISIENTGACIPEKDLSRLFEAFYRVDASRSRQTGGSGLGLYIVKTILDLHDARIELANTAQGVIALVWFAGAGDGTGQRK